MAKARRIRLGLRFYVVAAMLMVMVFGVLIISIITQQLAQRFFMTEKENSTGILMTVLARDVDNLDVKGDDLRTDQGQRAVAEALVRRHFNPLFMTRLAIISPAKIPLAGTVPMAELQAMANDAKGKIDNEAPVAYYRDEDHGMSIRVLAPLQVSHISLGYVIVDYTVGELNALLLFSSSAILLYALVYGLVAVLVGVVAIDSLLLKPIKRLLEVTATVASGEYPVPDALDIPATGEMQPLVANFAVMVTSLREKQAEVQRRITELEQVNRELEQAQVHLMRSEKMASLGQLAAGLAHELGNPLSAIQGLAEILGDDGYAEAEKRDLLPDLKREVERMTAIIRGLLTYARPGGGERSIVDLRSLLIGTVRLVMPQAIFRYVHIALDAPEAAGWNIMAVREGLEQALVNLLLNAAQAMDGQGEIRIRLRVLGEVDTSLKERFMHKLDPGRSHFMLTIEDSGPGIDPEKIHKIFDPFFTTKAVGEGTGLGLSITQKIIEENDGIIDVESAPGSGAIFVIFLPAYADEEDDGEGGDSATGGTG